MTRPCPTSSTLSLPAADRFVLDTAATDSHDAESEAAVDPVDTVERLLFQPADLRPPSACHCRSGPCRAPVST